MSVQCGGAWRLRFDCMNRGGFDTVLRLNGTFCVALVAYEGAAHATALGLNVVSKKRAGWFRTALQITHGIRRLSKNIWCDYSTPPLQSQCNIFAKLGLFGIARLLPPKYLTRCASPSARAGGADHPACDRSTPDRVSHGNHDDLSIHQ